MTREEAIETIKAAKALVAKMPVWKQNFLIMSAESHNSTSRLPARSHEMLIEKIKKQ